MKTSQIITAFAFAMTLVGCSASVDAPPVDLGDLGNIGNGGTTSPVVSPAGTWSTGCVLEGGYYSQSTLKFNGANIEADVEVYTSSSCATVWASDHATGTYQIAGASETVKGAMKVDFQLTWSDGSKENRYDLFLIEGNKMFLGKDAGSTPTSRPTDVDRNLSYQKLN